MPTTAAPSPSLRATFNRIDADHSGDFDRGELVGFLRELGVSAGKADIAAGRILSDLDAVEDRVTWQQFIRGSRKLLPQRLLDERGNLDPRRAEPLFRAIAGRAETANEKKLAKYLTGELRANAPDLMTALFAGTAAEIAAKIAMTTLDTDGDKQFRLDDLLALVHDTVMELGRVG
jgi:hypothetical protein